MTVAYGKLPFEEQLRFFRNKLNIPTESYADIYGAEHDHAFVVAGANRLDLLADFRTAVDKAIADGTTLEEFRRDFDAIVAKYGWEYNGGRDWRSRIIYDTNLHSSYQAGRYEQQREASRYRPYWEYKHREGQRHPRPEHEAWDGLVLHCDDPWWQTHYPINAYGCKCTVFAHNARSLAKRGLKVGTAPPTEYEERVIGKNSANPRVVQVPQGLDPGFDHIPGASRSNTQFLFDKATTVPPLMASNAVQDALDNPDVRELIRREVVQMVDGVFAEMASADPVKKTKGIKKSVGVILPDVLKALQKEKNYLPPTSVITLQDADILHSIRTTKDRPIPQEAWRDIVDMLASPRAVLLDDTTDPPALLYYCEHGPHKNKIVLKLEGRGKARSPLTGKSTALRINHIRTATLLDTDEKIISLRNGYKILYGDVPQP